MPHTLDPPGEAESTGRGAPSSASVQRAHDERPRPRPGPSPRNTDRARPRRPAPAFCPKRAGCGATPPRRFVRNARTAAAVSPRHGRPSRRRARHGAAAGPGIRPKRAERRGGALHSKRPSGGRGRRGGHVDRTICPRRAERRPGRTCPRKEPPAGNPMSCPRSRLDRAGDRSGRHCRFRGPGRSCGTAIREQ